MNKDISKCSSFCHPEGSCSLTADGQCFMVSRPRCYNRPPAKDYIEVQDGWTEDGRRNTVFYPNNMSRGCQQWGPKGEALLKNWKCDGCIWKPVNMETKEND